MTAVPPDRGTAVPPDRELLSLLTWETDRFRADPVKGTLPPGPGEVTVRVRPPVPAYRTGGRGRRTTPDR